MSVNRALLGGMLTTAVPLWVEQLRGVPHERLLRRARGELVEYTALADTVLTDSDTKPTLWEYVEAGAASGECLVRVRTADGFNRVTEALAIMILVGAPDQTIEFAGARFVTGQQSAIPDQQPAPEETR